MSKNDTNWTTVAGKPGKGKAAATASSTKSTGPPAMPKAEQKTIKLSDSAFSAMKDRIGDENDENDSGETKVPKPAVTVEKNPSVKPTKPNKPTPTALTLKQALQNIDVGKLKQLYQSSNDNKSLWVDKVCYWFLEQVKDVSSGLNDPTFSKENNADYPLNTFPSSVRDYLDEIFDTQSKLKAIALCRKNIGNANTDISQIVGYQILLQYLLRTLTEQPDNSFLDDVDKLSAALKQYPSDKVLRLLWSYSQVQYEHPGLALDIWFRLMFPLIDNRTYNQLVVENLSQLTTRNSKTKKFIRSIEIFPVESYIKLLEFIDRTNPALTKELRSSLTKSATTLSELFSNNSKNLSQHSKDYFRVLFPVLHSDKERPANIQAAIDRMILACCEDKSVMKTWLLLHEDYPQSSLHLLSLLKTHETWTKELRNILAQLRTISNETKSNTGHQEYLRVYGKTDTVVAKKRQTPSKSRTGSFFKLLVFAAIAFTIYSNWLWLTVAADYLLEDYLKHPVAIQVKERLSAATKNIEPYAVQVGQHLQKQWNFLLKYIEGPVYDTSVEIAEQIQRVSIIVFNQSVRYLSIFFDWASYYTAHFTSLTEVYIKQGYIILYDQWKNLDLSDLRKKIDQLRTRVVKSI